VDARTGGRRLTGYELRELKPMRGHGYGKGTLELMLWTTRHSEMDLLEIKNAISKHPGTTPVLLHFQNSAGRRVTVAANESFNVKRSEALEAALDRWIEE
jgi:DNA polymerase-3 subunit alpha